MTRATAVGRRAEYGLLAVAVAVVGAVCWHFASSSYFVADDLPVFYDAQVGGGYNLGFLGSEVIVHFSPGLRLVSLVIQRHAAFDFDVALGFILACHLAGVALLDRILRFWVGPVWSLALALAYGLSIIFTTALQWFSLGLQTLPPIAFSLAAIHAHLCWRRTRRPAWLAWSVVAMAGALAFYEKAVLVPVYLVLIVALLLEPERPLRERIREVAADWRVWALYAVPLVAYLVVYATRKHTDSWHTVPPHQTLEYLRIAWLDGFVPGLFAVRVTPTSGDLVHTWAVIGCQLAFLALVAVSVSRRSSAWRSWAFLIVAFLVNALIVLPRVSTLGTSIGYVLRYNAEVVALALIAVASAFSGARSEPASARAGRALVLAGAVAVALAGYAVLAVAADRAIERDWPGSFSRSWFDHVRTDLEAVRRRGTRPVLLDDQMPPRILPFWIRQGGNRLSATLPLTIGGLRFDEISGSTYRVGPDGHVRHVEFRPVETLPHTPCLPAGPRWRRIDLRPRRPLRGRAWYLHSRYRTTGAGWPLPGGEPRNRLRGGGGSRPSRAAGRGNRPHGAGKGGHRHAGLRRPAGRGPARDGRVPAAPGRGLLPGGLTGGYSNGSVPGEGLRPAAQDAALRGVLRTRAGRGGRQAAEPARQGYSHSMVPGGLLVMSKTTRLTSRSSLIMREAICSSRS